jgi:hypothetical protein
MLSALDPASLVRQLTSFRLSSSHARKIVCVLSRTNEKPAKAGISLVRDERLVPLFLIHYVHKNAGRSSLVFFQVWKENSVPLFKSLRKARRCFPHRARIKIAQPKVELTFILVRDERLELPTFSV